MDYYIRWKTADNAVLVAISIPIFSTQLEKSRDAVTVANLRSAYAEAATEILVDGDKDTTTTDKIESGEYDVAVKGTLTNGGIAGADVPFTFGDNVATTLDNSSNGATQTVVFTWGVTNGVVDDKPTVTISASGS